MTEKKTVRTRFAPSPTGYLHIGSLRTALYSYLFAKQHNGQFILRLEDTDQKRLVAGAEEAIYSGLKWAGLNYDEGPDINGPLGPYRQSERLALYKKHAQELLDKGLAYYCFCDAKTLEEMKQEQIARKRAPKYDRRCQKLSDQEIKKKLADGAPHTIRMKIPEGRKIEVNDLVRGQVIYNSDELDDQVLLKSDGFPTYHLAVVVDDHLMEITHVTRTEEWLPSTPKHILLYEYFGWEAPQWAHLPLLLNEDRTKMSKRKGDVAVGDYIKKGYLPEAMINYLAFLGWNPGSEQEIFSMEELLKDFKLERVHKAGAVFNLEKLNWYNSYYMRRREPKHFVLELKETIGVSDKSEASLTKAVAIELERSATEGELAERIKNIYHLPTYDKSLLCWKNMTDEEIKNSLELSQKILVAIPDDKFTAENLKDALMPAAEKMPNKGNLLWPLRVALSGQKNSPPPFDLAEILGKEVSLERIAGALSKLT